MNYFYSILGSIFIGIHIFSIKLINDHYHKNKSIDNHLLFLFLIFVITQIIGKIFIFLESDKIPIYLIHLIINCSIFTTLSLYIYFYNAKINFAKTIFGLFVTLTGLYIVEKSMY